MSEWISVKDRLPEYGVPVLVVYRGTVQYVTYSRDIGEWRASCCDDFDPMPGRFVTHWMPLPAPPEGA